MMMRSGGASRLGGRQGSALIVALWVTGLLAMLTATLAFEAHLESRITNYYRNRTHAFYAARSGMSLGQLLILKSAGLRGSQPDEVRAETERWYEDALRLAEGGHVTLEHALPMEEEGEVATIQLRIEPEPARRNINVIARERDDASMERILDVGGVPQEMWPTLIDSLYDWVDTDDDPRPDGAETDDYYATLPSPYRAKDGPLDTVGELRLVKGFSQAILEGGRLSDAAEGAEEIYVRGIEDLLTVHGDGKVNVNAASRDVLMTLPGMEDITADDIVRFRSEWTDASGAERRGFRSTAEFLAEYPDVPEEARSMITVDSAIYRLKTVGILYGVTHTIWSTVEVSGGDVQILLWREDG